MSETRDETAVAVWRTVLSELAGEGLETHAGCEEDAPGDCSIYGLISDVLAVSSERATLSRILTLCDDGRNDGEVIEEIRKLVKAAEPPKD